MAKKPAKKIPKLLRPGMVVLACMCFWAAQHEPGQFDAGSVGAWLLGAVTAGLVMEAVFALVLPAVVILSKLAAGAIREMQSGGES